MATKETMESDRLILRQWIDQDYEPFARINADPEVMKYFPSVLSREESDALADRIRSLIGENGWGFWALALKTTGEFIGFTGLNVPSYPLPFSPCVEVGWRLARQFWGNGYAPEAGREALRFGFKTLGLREMVSFTATGNQRSQSVMVKIGMRNANAPFDHPSVPEGHPLKPHVLYRISLSEWKNASTIQG